MTESDDGKDGWFEVVPLTEEDRELAALGRRARAEREREWQRMSPEERAAVEPAPDRFHGPIGDPGPAHRGDDAGRGL